MGVLLYLCLSLLPGASGQAGVDEADPDADPDARVLAGLGDDDYQVRQITTRRLLTDDTLTQAHLDRLFIASETPEQRHRLLRVARHHVLRRMIAKRFDKLAGPGSMGLSHQVVEAWEPGKQKRAGVMVVLTLPGFPAYALLEPGDVIVGFDGKPIPEKVTAAKFQQMIRGRQAREVIGLTVVRDGNAIQMQFRLGNGQALGEVYDTNGLVLAAAYRRAWQEERSRMEGLIDSGNEKNTEDAEDTATTSE